MALNETTKVGIMKGNISLDSVKPYRYLTGARAWLVTCGECAGRALQYDNGQRERADFCRSWIVDASEAAAARTLARHNGLHHASASK